jgi:hypothetical protein
MSNGLVDLLIPWKHLSGARMPDELWRLVYVSAASHDLSDAELVALLDVSRQLNLRDGITGALAYYDQRFLQVLEGNEVLVEALFQRICHDPRNDSIMTITRSPVAGRAFEDWSMGWVPAKELKRAGFGLRMLYSPEASLDMLDELFITFRKLGWPS